MKELIEVGIIITEYCKKYIDGALCYSLVEVESDIRNISINNKLKKHNFTLYLDDKRLIVPSYENIEIAKTISQKLKQIGLDNNLIYDDETVKV